MNDEQQYELYRRVCKHYEERGEDLNKREFIQHKHELFDDEELAEFLDSEHSCVLATAMLFFVTALSSGYSTSHPSSEFVELFGHLLVQLKLEESND